MFWRWQAETNTYAHASIDEDPRRISRNALTMPTGEVIAFMRGSAKINAQMKAYTKIRSEQVDSPVVCMTYESPRQ